MSNHITLDLVGLILKWSAVKSILRWRSVCKSWKNLIDSNLFALDHLSVQRPRLLVQNAPSKYVVIDPQTFPLFHTFTGPFTSDSVRISNTVHGVTCILVLPSYSGLVPMGTTSLYLWNPSLHRLLQIPLPYPDWYPYEHYTHISLWIDPYNNHTKIAIFYFHLKSISLFSSTKSQPAWTQIAMNTAKDCVVRTNVRQVLIDRVAYWTMHYQDLLVACNYLLVAYFDFIRDEFGTIDLPSELANKPHTTNVCKWQDSLSLIHWKDKEYCCLWATQDRISWSKIFSLNLFDEVRDVLFMEESRGRILAQTASKGPLILYDVKKRQEGIRLNSEFRDTYIGFFVAYDYVESLVFPDLKFISSDFGKK